VAYACLRTCSAVSGKIDCLILWNHLAEEITYKIESAMACLSCYLVITVQAIYKTQKCSSSVLHYMLALCDLHASSYLYFASLISGSLDYPRK
jgi:hypothetical protein